MLFQESKQAHQLLSLFRGSGDEWCGDFLSALYREFPDIPQMTGDQDFRAQHFHRVHLKLFISYVTHHILHLCDCVILTV